MKVVPTRGDISSEPAASLGNGEAQFRFHLVKYLHLSTCSCTSWPLISISEHDTFIKLQSPIMPIALGGKKEKRGEKKRTIKKKSSIKCQPNRDEDSRIGSD